MVSPPSQRALLLAVALMIAGCTAPTGTETPGSSTDTGSPSKTAVGSPSPTQSSTEAPRPVTPPGVRNAALANESALLSAHIASFRKTGYRLETTTGDSRMTYVAASNYSSFRVAPGPTTSKPAIWANESMTLARLTQNNGTTYQRPPRFWANPAQMTGAETLRELFDAGTYVRNGTTRCGDRSCAVLVATNGSRFRNFSAEALVDESGVVRRFHATYTHPSGNRSTTVEYRLRVTRVGNVTVERPIWVDDAIAETG